MEDFRTLYVDPGEDTGWCLGRDTKLLAAGTEKMWPFADEAYAEIAKPTENASVGILGRRRDNPFLREGMADFNEGNISRIVCEDFRIYPWEAKNLAWDQVRTARLIGALTFMARLYEIPFVLQGAKIKERAVAGGAEELFYKPLTENRHQNDAIMHFVYFTQTELLGLELGEQPSAEVGLA